MTSTPDPGGSTMPTSDAPPSAGQSPQDGVEGRLIAVNYPLKGSTRVYISGPIVGAARHLTFEQKRKRFYQAAILLEERDCEAVNPFEVGPCSGMYCDPGQLADQPPGIHTWDCYMRHDIAAMMSCNTIAMLPHWLDSPGARLEYHIAMALNFKPIFFDADELEEVEL